MQFKPNFDLLRYWNSAEKLESFVATPPCIAIFRKSNKTLVYMCDVHGENRSFDMVDMCFADDFGYKPEVLLTEVENFGYDKRMGWYDFQTDTLVYAAGVGAQKGIPVVFADLSDSQCVDVINSGFPDNQITEKNLGEILHSEPNMSGNLYERMSAYLDMYGRDRFMLQNIAMALNEHDIVFVICGAGHYENQRLVLEDMLGMPKWITKDIKNMRGDFSDVKIEPIKLCEFEMVKNDNKS